MKKFLIIPILFIAMQSQAQRPKLDTLASGKIMLTYYVRYELVRDGNNTTVMQPVTVETFKTELKKVIVDGKEKEVLVPTEKRYVIIHNQRINIFRREPKDEKGHYEFAKF